MRWLMILLAAVTLAGCTPSREAPPAPDGIHLLADASVTATEQPGLLLRVEHRVNIINDGTAVCGDLDVWIDWPEALKLLEGSWAGPTSPMTPGDRGAHTVEWLFDVKAMTKAQAEQALKETRFRVVCREPKGYENLTLPSVRF